MTQHDLLTLWRLRDVRYRTRRTTITEREAECVRAYRRQELTLVVGPRDQAVVALLAWQG